MSFINITTRLSHDSDYQTEALITVSSVHTWDFTAFQCNGLHFLMDLLSAIRAFMAKLELIIQSTRGSSLLLSVNDYTC